MYCTEFTSLLHFDLMSCIYVCASEVSCPWKHVCVSVNQLSVQQWMGGCHNSCSLSRCTYVIDSNDFVTESNMLVQNHIRIVIVTLSVILFPSYAITFHD